MKGATCILFTLLSAISIFQITQSKADECDPTKILIQDSANTTTTLKQSLQTANTVDKTQTQKIDLSGLTGGSDKENADFSNALKSTFNSDYRGEYATTASYLTLSQNAKQAYIACLKAKSQHLFLYPADNVMEATGTFVTARLEAYVDTRLVKLAITVDGAKLADGQAKQVNVNSGQSTDIRVTRDLSKPFTVHVTAGAGGETESLSVSAQSTTKLIRENRYSPPQLFGHGQNGQHQVHDLCVQLAGDDDAILIPGTAQILRPVNVISRGGQFSQISVDNVYNPKSTCVRGDAYDDGTNGVDIHICAYVVAQVVVQIPVSDAKSKYADIPAADANCK